MGERFLLRTEGGPYPGTRRVTEGEFMFPFLPDPAVHWPLPDELPVGDRAGEPAGSYVKTGESTLDPQPEDSGVLRGAEYEWRSA